LFAATVTRPLCGDTTTQRETPLANGAAWLRSMSAWAATRK
jgi:hypothetical protein